MCGYVFIKDFEFMFLKFIIEYFKNVVLFFYNFKKFNKVMDFVKVSVIWGLRYDLFK